MCPLCELCSTKLSFFMVTQPILIFALNVIAFLCYLFKRLLQQFQHARFFFEIFLLLWRYLTQESFLSKPNYFVLNTSDRTIVPYFFTRFFYPFCLYTRKYSSRSNPPEVLEKSVLKICIRFTGEHSCKHLQKAMTAKLKKRNWNPFFVNLLWNVIFFYLLNIRIVLTAF